MHNLEEDIDNMFREAAEGYPIRTDGTDWGKVRAGAASRTKSYRRYLVAIGLLLCLSIAIVCRWNGTSSKFNHSVTEQALTAEKNSISSSEIPTAKQTLIEEDVGNISTVAPGNTDKYKFSANSKSVKGATTSYNNYKLANKEPYLIPPRESVPHNTAFYGLYNTSPIISELRRNNTEHSKIFDNRLLKASMYPIRDLTVLSIPKITKSAFLGIDRSNKIYFGGGLGVTCNWVKDQEWSPPKPIINIFTGKKIAKNVFVETGVGYEEISYYTRGEFFYPKTGDMPSNMEVRSVQSSTTSLSIPVEIKYDMVTGNKKFYLKAGINNRLFLREKNTYDAVMSGVAEEVKAEYNDKKFQPLSDVQFAVGLGMPAGSSHTISIEPYLRIPLKGMGVGNVSVMQSGMQVVLRRRK